ncbi:MAG: hypothetical protein RIS70_1074 [Planctomycetota bacterium]|jgi:tryptophan synthase alpha chain
MSAIDRVFEDYRKQNRRLIVPFITAGDPDLEFTGNLLVELASQGCPIIEIGVPYSDPIADGPVIQASYTRALANRITVEQILDTLSSVRSRHKACVVTMVSYAIVHRMGLEHYVSKAKSAGVHGLIVPDLLVEESQSLASICAKHEMSLIQLVTPTTPRERALRIAEASSGFLYYVSVTGITGERQSLPKDLAENVAWLRSRTKLPICIGFGISSPDHIRNLAPSADGLIVGSAIVRRIENCPPADRPNRIREIGEYVGSLIAALPNG